MIFFFFFFFFFFFLSTGAYQRCDFEMSTCSWEQSSDDDLDWLWIDGNQGGQLGGAPGVDHTHNDAYGKDQYSIIKKYI